MGFSTSGDVSGQEAELLSEKTRVDALSIDQVVHELVYRAVQNPSVVEHYDPATEQDLGKAKYQLLQTAFSQKIDAERKLIIGLYNAVLKMAEQQALMSRGGVPRRPEDNHNNEEMILQYVQQQLGDAGYLDYDQQLPIINPGLKL